MIFVQRLNAAPIKKLKSTPMPASSYLVKFAREADPQKLKVDQFMFSPSAKVKPDKNKRKK